VRPDDRNDLRGACPAEKTVDIEFDRSFRRGKFAFRVKADNFEIGTSAGGTDIVG